MLNRRRIAETIFGIVVFSLWTVAPAAASCPNGSLGISSLSPTGGPVATEVVIEGSCFTGATQVLFNGANAPQFGVLSDTEIEVYVPPNALTGSVSVVTPNGTVTKNTVLRCDTTCISIPAFTDYTPAISGYSPAGGVGGTKVTINGTGFSNNGAATSVTFDGVSAAFTVNSDTQITATVPAGATGGYIQATGPYGTDQAPGIFGYDQTSPYDFGGGVGSLTFGSSYYGQQCYIAYYYLGGWHYNYYTYYVDNYSNFVYVPGSSSGLANQPISGSEEMITGSPGPGFGQQDTCPADQSGQTLTYNSPTNGTAYTVTILPVGSGEVNSEFSMPGYMNPKWAVVAILYAPPGEYNAGTNVADYNSSQLVSVTNSVDKTFSTNRSMSSSLTLRNGADIPGLLNMTVEYTNGKSASFTQTTEDGSSTTVSKESSVTLGVGSGPSGYAGLDHDWDVLRVWLNPVSRFTVGNGGVKSWDGYGFAAADSASPYDLDVRDAHLGCLNGNFLPAKLPPGLNSGDPAAELLFLQNFCGGEMYGTCTINYGGDPSTCPSKDWAGGPFIRSWAVSGVAAETFDSPDTPPTNPPLGYNAASISPADIASIEQLDPWWDCTNVSDQPSGQDWTNDSTGACPSPNPEDDVNNPTGYVSNEPGVAALEGEFTPIASGVDYCQGCNLTTTYAYQDMNSNSATSARSSTQSFGWEHVVKVTDTLSFLYGLVLTRSLTNKGEETTTRKSNTSITQQYSNNTRLSSMRCP